VIAKNDAIFGQCIDVWRPHDAFAKTAERVPAQIGTENENDTGSLVSRAAWLGEDKAK